MWRRVSSSFDRNCRRELTAALPLSAGEHDQLKDEVACLLEEDREAGEALVKIVRLSGIAAHLAGVGYDRSRRARRLTR